HHPHIKFCRLRHAHAVGRALAWSETKIASLVERLLRERLASRHGIPATMLCMWSTRQGVQFPFSVGRPSRVEGRTYITQPAEIPRYCCRRRLWVLPMVSRKTLPTWSSTGGAVQADRIENKLPRFRRRRRAPLPSRQLHAETIR